MKIYVASSWRNDFQPGVVKALRQDGHAVYDFKDEEGFQWKSVDPHWQTWTTAGYINGLRHPAAEAGYNRDMKALRECDICVYVMPCGVSASAEMGWAAGAGKRVVVFIPKLREPDLMMKMADLITADWDQVRAFCSEAERAP